MIFCIEVVIFWLLSVALVQHEWAISERDEWMIGKEIIEREYNLLKYDVRFLLSGQVNIYVNEKSDTGFSFDFLIFEVSQFDLLHSWIVL